MSTVAGEGNLQPAECSELGVSCVVHLLPGDQAVCLTPPGWGETEGKHMEGEHGHIAHYLVATLFPGARTHTNTHAHKHTHTHNKALILIVDIGKTRGKIQDTKMSIQLFYNWA